MGTSYTGRILRWMGSVEDPFNWIEVGRVDGVPRELTEHVDENGESRIAVSARGVFLSPPVPNSGLWPLNAYSWTNIWNPNQYEPDYTTRITYVGGGIASLEGKLYVTTRHIPGNAADLHTTCTIDPYNIPLPSSTPA